MERPTPDSFHRAIAAFAARPGKFSRGSVEFVHAVLQVCVGAFPMAEQQVRSSNLALLDAQRRPRRAGWWEGAGVAWKRLHFFYYTGRGVQLTFSRIVFRFAHPPPPGFSQKMDEARVPVTLETYNRLLSVFPGKRCVQ